MKKLVLLVLSIILFTACDNDNKDKNDKRYTQKSAEIDTYKKTIADYEKQDWNALKMHYADTAKIQFNATNDNAITVDKMIAQHQDDAGMFTSWKYDPEDVDYEMVVTDDGETWVNFWGDWKGTLKENNKVYTIPVHLTARFEDGKIVRELGYWSISELMNDLNAMEADKNLPVEQKTMKTALDNIVKAWNANDKNMMYTNFSDKMERYGNGSKMTTTNDDYGKFMDANHTAFSNFKVETNKVEMSGNKAYLHWTVTGKNTGEYAGHAPTNKTIKLPGLSIFTFNKDVKAVKEDAYYDNLLVYQQLGINTITAPGAK